MRTDFSKITPCGGDCRDCGHFISGECKGCLSEEGRSVKLWEKDCEIFSCCKRHNVRFCGLCHEFPCEWLENKIGQWDKDGIIANDKNFCRLLFADPHGVNAANGCARQFRSNFYSKRQIYLSFTIKSLVS